MKTPVLWLIGAIFLFCFVAVIYALHRGRDVRASMKVWFAEFSFETTEPKSGSDVAVKHR